MYVCIISSVIINDNKRIVYLCSFDYKLISIVILFQYLNGLFLHNYFMKAFENCTNSKQIWDLVNSELYSAFTLATGA